MVCGCCFEAAEVNLNPNRTDCLDDTGGKIEWTDINERTSFFSHQSLTYCMIPILMRGE